MLSNQVDFVANADEAVHAREGWYSCVLYKRSHQNGLTSNLDHDANASIAGSKHAEWDLENLSCSLYPSSSEHWDEQIHRFDLAVIDLAAQVRRTNAS